MKNDSREFCHPDQKQFRTFVVNFNTTEYGKCI